MTTINNRDTHPHQIFINSIFFDDVRLYRHFLSIFKNFGSDKSRTHDRSIT